jgi:hypothetical protein
MGMGAEPRDPSRYGPSNPGLMAPEDPGTRVASPRATLLETLAPGILVLAVPCGVPPTPDTSIVNTTTGRWWMSRANKGWLLPPEHRLSQV